MAGVGLRRRGWARGSTARVDWSHPLAAGLVVCAVPGGPVNGWRSLGPHELVPTTSSSTAPLAAGQWGSSIDTTGAVAKRGMVETNVTFGGGGVTFMVALTPTISTLSVCMGSKAGTDIWLGSSGSGFQMRSSAGNASSGSYQVGVPTVLVGVASSVITWLYWNGTRYGVGGGATNVQGVTIAGYRTGSFDLYGRYALACAYDRALSESEVSQVIADPFCMLRGA